MSDRKASVSLAEFRDKRQAEGAINIDLGDGSDPVVIPAAELWPDDLPSVTRKAEFAKAIIGESEWDRFVAAGGTYRLFESIFDSVTKQRQGVAPGES